ncbi:MAG: L-threonylcarbamoyladenylate synthase, partial [Parachlamydiaceae bacterium]|nr:L-threonylcarbamoyladenylate synthase [Parachlamydiaceae bacterium]
MKISFLDAVNKIKQGEVIAVPTETVYGLAASIDCPDAIEKIFKIKHRPTDNPLIIHVGDLDQMSPFIFQSPPGFQALANHFWPGPLTCILPIQPEKIPSIARAGLLTAGFRIPMLELTRQLLLETGPLVMPSANLSGKPSATRSEHVENDFGSDFPVLDGGGCLKGVESTIVMYRDPFWVILREGAIASEQFESILGYQPKIIKKESNDKPLCPGQKFRHYAPYAHLSLGDEEGLKESSHVLGFQERQYPEDKKMIYLGSLNDPEQVARNL